MNNETDFQNQMRAAWEDFQNEQSKLKGIDFYTSTETAIEKVLEATTALLIKLMGDKDSFIRKTDFDSNDVNLISYIWDETMKKYINGEKLHSRVSSVASESQRGVTIEINSKMEQIGYSEFRLVFLWSLEKNFPENINIFFTLTDSEGEIVGDMKDISIVFSGNHNKDCIDTARNSINSGDTFTKKVSRNGQLIIYQFPNGNPPSTLKLSAIGEFEAGGEVYKAWISTYLE